MRNLGKAGIFLFLITMILILSFANTAFCGGLILNDLDVDENKIKNVIAWFRVNDELTQNYRSYHQASLLKPTTNMNRSYTAVATPTLDHFSSDLTLEAISGNLDLCIERNKEITSIFEAYAGGHAGVLLVGPTGVGKRTIVEGLARLMVKESVPKFLQDKRLIELDLAALISGATPSGAQERLLNCLTEVNQAGNIILYNYQMQIYQSKQICFSCQICQFLL